MVYDISLKLGYNHLLWQHISTYIHLVLYPHTTERPQHKTHDTQESQKLKGAMEPMSKSNPIIKKSKTHIYSWSCFHYITWICRLSLCNGLILTLALAIVESLWLTWCQQRGQHRSHRGPAGKRLRRRETCVLMGKVRHYSSLNPVAEYSQNMYIIKYIYIYVYRYYTCPIDILDIHV